MLPVGLNLYNSGKVNFGNQTKRGKLLNVKAFIDNNMVDEFLPARVKNKLSRDKTKFDKISDTRWNPDNVRYQGKDKTK